MRLFIFMLCQTIYSVVLHGTRPIVSLYAHSLGANEIVIGLLVSAFALLPMILAIQIGKWLDIFGARKLTVLGGTGIVIALVLPVLMPNIFTLFLSQLLIGISHLATLVSLQKTVGNYPGNRDKLIASFSLTGSFGELVGPLFMGFSYQFLGFQTSYFISGLLTLVAIGAAFLVKSNNWITVKQHPITTKTKSTTFSLLKNSNLRKALVVSGLVLYSKDVFVAYFPVYGSKAGLSPAVIGSILSIMAAASIIIRIFQFKLVHRFGRANVLTASLLISGIAYLALPFTTSMISIGIFVFLLGGGLGLGQPLSLVYSLNHSPEGRQGEVLGLRLTFNRGSQFTAPFLFGGLGTLFGLSPVFWLSGAILLIATRFTRMKKGAESLPEKKVKES